jgi:hypothetical protein
VWLQNVARYWQSGRAMMLTFIAECASVVLFIFAMVLLLAVGGMA